MSDAIVIDDIDDSYKKYEDDLVVVTMTTKRPRPSDAECVVIGTTKKKTDLDCTIHDVTRDNGIVYLSTKRKTTPTITTPSATPNATPINDTSSITNTCHCHSMQPMHDAFRMLLQPSVSVPCICSSAPHQNIAMPTSITTPTSGATPTRNTTSGKRKGRKPKQTVCVIPSSSDIPLNTSPNTDREASLFITSSSAPFATTLNTPPWWTTPTDTPAHSFTLIDLDPSSVEAFLVSAPLERDGFIVTVIQRIQCPGLWRRYMGEVRLYLEERGEGTDLNERLLYHRSRAPKPVICGEGLDIRLSCNGNFGKGIYFSDKPMKCDRYGLGNKPSCMFGCKVILGQVKAYDTGTSDSSLVREPQKQDGTFYDSVLGFISLGEEYVIYNNYRAVPLYYMEYATASTSNKKGRGRRKK